MSFVRPTLVFRRRFLQRVCASRFSSVPSARAAETKAQVVPTEESAVSSAAVLSTDDAVSSAPVPSTDDADSSTAILPAEDERPRRGRARTSPAARLAQAKQDNQPHFKRGYKEIWLPDFEVTFIQTPDLDPRFAKFRVPLNIGKLDFRDFLWHGYQTRALSIRSWVYQRPKELSERLASGESRARWHRKEALKYMIVEMDEPFVWPKLPEDLSAFDPDLFKRMKRSATLRDGKGGMERWYGGTDVRNEDRKQLRKTAQSILSGDVKWRPTHEVYARPRYH